MKYKVTYSSNNTPDEEIEADQVEVRDDFVVFFDHSAASNQKGARVAALRRAAHVKTVTSVRDEAAAS